MDFASKAEVRKLLTSCPSEMFLIRQDHIVIDMVKVHFSINLYFDREMKMKHLEKRARVLTAYDDLVESSRLAASLYSPTHRYWVLERAKYLSCGKELVVPRTGQVVRHYCRRPSCPACAGFWGKRLMARFLARYPRQEHDDFSMITMIVAVSQDLDGLLDAFRLRRKALSNAVHYQRTRGLDRKEWRLFGLAGSLEIDAFDAAEFAQLGPQKQAQYRALGFEPAGKSGPVWVATAHGLARTGSLGITAVQAALASVAPVIHLQPLDERQSLREAAKRVGSYAAKVGIETGLAFDEHRPWSAEMVTTYIDAVARYSKGRQGFRIHVGPQRKRSFAKNSTSASTLRHLEPMPILIA